MSIESRAARAAAAVNRSVAAARPAPVGAITRRHRLGLVTAVAFFGILAGASVAFAAMLPGGADEEITASETTTVTTMAPTTLPSEPGPAVVVLPADGQGEGEGQGQGEGVPGGDGEIVFVAAMDPTDLTSSGSWDQFFYGCEFPTTTTTPEVPTDITAHQYYGPVSSTAYEKVYGTAPPGTRVRLTSAYGSSEATVGSSGEYWLKVYFSGQPSNQYFPITAKIGEETFTFQFKWTGTYTVTANQYYGPINDERKDKVYGTAPPGTHVIATSEYGSSDLTVGAEGEYWLHIYFNESLPADTPITWTAKLKDPGGAVLLQKTFDFTYVPAGGTATAEQCVYPKVSEDPWQKVCGWVPANSRVVITSDHGSAETTTSGDYYLKIHFDTNTLPPNQWIDFTTRIYDAEDNLLLEKVFEYKWEPASGDPTAEQCVYPKVSEDPWQKVCGWVPANSRVVITSDHGSAETTTSGDYYLKIHFDTNTLPPNQWIDFTTRIYDAEDNLLLEKVFEYKWEPVYDTTANQKWGPVYSLPTEKIYGTAAPGSEVSAT
ncbi:MAG: hypothetical protein KQH83_12420, partial [Actinobacteria bacterium]|nr:hypothetical protein [Actinomycetota bacterium]